MIIERVKCDVCGMESLVGVNLLKWFSFDDFDELKIETPNPTIKVGSKHACSAACLHEALSKYIGEHNAKPKNRV